MTDTRAGWLVNPTDESVERDVAALSQAMLRQYAEWEKRSELRERMGMVITIDRAGTPRSIAAESVG